MNLTFLIPKSTTVNFYLQYKPGIMLQNSNDFPYGRTQSKKNKVCLILFFAQMNSMNGVSV